MRTQNTKNTTLNFATIHVQEITEVAVCTNPPLFSTFLEIIGIEQLICAIRERLKQN